MKITQTFIRDLLGEHFLSAGFARYKNLFYRRHEDFIQYFFIGNYQGSFQAFFDMCPLFGQFYPIGGGTINLMIDIFRQHPELFYTEPSNPITFEITRKYVQEKIVPLFEQAKDARSAYDAWMRYFSEKRSAYMAAHGSYLQNMEAVLQSLRNAAPQYESFQFSQSVVPPDAPLDQLCFEDATTWKGQDLIAMCIKCGDYDTALKHLDLILANDRQRSQYVNERSGSTAIVYRKILKRDALEIRDKIERHDAMYFEEMFQENQRQWEEYLLDFPKPRTPRPQDASTESEAQRNEE